MAYFICEVHTDCAHEAEIVALLNDCGVAGVAVEGAAFVREAIAEGLAEIWDEQQIQYDDDSLVVKGFYPEDQDITAEKEKLTAALAIYEMLNGVSLQYSFYSLADEEWQDAWKQYYKPFRVGNRLIIKPTWEDYVPEKEDIIIELDPGLAFGTGSHPTTNGALRLLERYVKAGDQVLDCGCGSGILAVAAAKLGAEKVYAVDIDHDAVLSAVRNIRINGLFTKIEVFCDDVTKRSFQRLAPFQIVVANIVADVILPMLHSATALTEKGNLLIAGGIIAHRKEEVFAALAEHGFSVKDVLCEGDWVTLAAERI